MNQPLLRYAATLALAFSAGALCDWLNTPLPWMLGPLLVTAAGRLAGLPLGVPDKTRNLGQWLIGITLGLYFSPSAATQALGILPLILLGSLIAVLAGALCGHLLGYLTKTNAATSFFAAMPGGASEMAILAERYGARPDLVAAAHTLRVVLVVALIPALYYAFDLHGNAPADINNANSNLWQLAGLGLAGAFGALIWRWLGQANAWILGPLFVTALLTGSDLAHTQMPGLLSALGQLCLGTALGSRFSPDFLREAPRFLAASLLTTVLMTVLLSLAGLVMAWFSGLNPPSTVLGLSPGGIAEMCITAKALHLSVPIVTSFHVIRAMAVVVLAGPVFRLLHGRKT